MATYDKVDKQREMAKKAAMYDQLVAESDKQSSQKQGLMQGIKFGAEQGYDEGMRDNNATSEQAYNVGRQHGAEEVIGGAPDSNNPNLISDQEGANYPGYVPENQQDLQQYAASVVQAVDQQGLDPAKAQEMIAVAEDNLKQIMNAQQGQQAQQQGQGFGKIGQALTQQAAQMSMQ